MKSEVVKFEGIELSVVKDQKHEWILSTEQVALGYGVQDKTVYQTKNRKSNELKEGKHWMTLQTVDSLGRSIEQIFWTKRGIVRLGFSMRGERAVKFRDWAEDLVIEKVEQKPLSQLEIIAQSAQILLEQDKRISSVENKLKLIEAKATTRPEYFTVAGYASLHNTPVNIKQAAHLGRQASNLCKQTMQPIDSCFDPRFGKVNMYPTNVLDVVFSKPINI